MADDIATRVAQQTLARRRADYTDEVRRLLDAALAVMRRCGTNSRPRVVDIVAEAGLSNDAFYRHFTSKDALVAALLEDGTERLRSYLEHQMAKERTPEGQVRRWVEGVLGQTDAVVGQTTRAVLYNSGSVADGRASGRHPASGVLAPLLHEPFTDLGSTDAGLAAAFATHAVMGLLADHLWLQTRPARKETDRIVRLCVSAAQASTVKP